MKDIFTVIKFTMKDMLGRKSFRISTIIIMLLIILGFNVPNILNSLGGGDFSEKILLSDPDNVYQGLLENINNSDGYEFIVETSDLDTIKAKIETGEIDSAVMVNKGDHAVKLQYVVKNAALSSTPQDLTDLLGVLYKSAQISQLGLTDAQIDFLATPLEPEVIQTDEEEIHGNIFVMMLLSIVLFYAIYFCAFQVSSSITTEKTSKIMETLVTSTTPRTIVLGKTIGIGLVGLLQMILFISTALISANLFLDHEMLATVLDLSSITPLLGLIAVLYFILGYAVYALLYALTGSTVSKPEDIQSANTPIALLTLVSFYLAYFTLTDPTSSLNLFAAIFPFSSPFCMPIRFMMGLASIPEILISVIILVTTIVIIARVTIKIYSNAILNYGSKMSFKDIIKAYKEK